MTQTHKVLVTGGCGYIGSHTIIDLLDKGYEVLCLDNLSRSKELVTDLMCKVSGRNIKLHKIDLKDKEAITDFFNQHPDISSVIHFAAYKSVPESVSQPLMYFENNITGMINLLDAVVNSNVQQFIFSSSCSVYGEPQDLPVTEDTLFGEALSPYAMTKQSGEQILQQLQAHNPAFKTVILRYFNPVGAHPSGMLGELPVDTPNNLVPFITQTAIGKRKELTIYGEDYPTRDGTCIRDYIHVMDIAAAHRLSITFAESQPQKHGLEVFNLGTGNGVTVLEAVQAFEKVNALKLNYRFGGRRAGDVVQVFASNEKAKSHLGWELKYTLEEMMSSAWKWERFLSDKF